jgi:hypothetical protein
MVNIPRPNWPGGGGGVREGTGIWGWIRDDALMKKKIKFSSYMIGNSDGIGYKVINEEGLPNTWGNAQI